MTALGAWTFDPTVVVIVVLGLGYWRSRPRHTVTRTREVCFGAGLALWTLALMSPVAVLASHLFWVRALQVLLLLYATPFLLALGSPVAVFRAGARPSVRDAVDRALASRAARIVCAPLTTSVVLLALPWLLYLTPWYVASMTNPAIGILTRSALLLAGFAYFYVRLQVDPVPRRFTPLLSMGISVIESLADGLLGLVLWLGPVIAYDYYAGLHRSVGPDMRTDQTIGAGILWILGDVLGIPFLLLLMRSLGKEERTKTAAVDRALDETHARENDPEGETDGGMWWERDPQLRERFTR